MATMHDIGPTKQSGGGLTAQVFVWGGVLLILIGGLLTYPYVSSRLATLPTAPAATSSALAFSFPSPTPAGVITHVPVPTHTLSHTPTPAQIRTPRPAHTHTPKPTPSPTSTRIPAFPTRIVIPSISVDAPIVPISWRTTQVDGQEQPVWDVPDMYAVGWHETSASLGVGGNTVLNGHNTTNGEVFRDLYTLKPGDAIVVFSEDVPYAYAVTDVLILPEAGQPLVVRLENARYTLPTDDERLTLVTCHPYGSLRNRLIVIAYPAATAGED